MIHVTMIMMIYHYDTCVRDHDHDYDDGGDNEDLGDDDADQLLEFTLHMCTGLDKKGR